MRSGLLVGMLLLASVAAVVSSAACDDTPGGGGGTTVGAGGAGGCPEGPPQALFTIVVRAEDGPVPADAKLIVNWSAGEEPPFDLAEQSTWLSLDEGSNVVCDVDRDQPPPTDLPELRCELWTSGATEVSIEADGYLTAEQTLQPGDKEGCDEPVPSETTIELEPDMGSGGAQP